MYRSSIQSQGIQQSWKRVKREAVQIFSPFVQLLLFFSFPIVLLWMFVVLLHDLEKQKNTCLLCHGNCMAEFFFFFLYSNWPTEAFMCHGVFKVTIGIAVSFFSFDIYSFSRVSFLLYTYFSNILYRHMCFKTAVDTFFFLWHILLNRLFLFPLYCLFVYMFSLSSFSTLTLYNFSNSFSIVTKISIGTLFFFFIFCYFFSSLFLSSPLLLFWFVFFFVRMNNNNI